ncbi:hypothetical protein [Acinetobacter baumannii]|uniref:hypothetical protein n=1 Tax=Acinetobacter baumannii TaxID=470 RepID=UPI0009FF2AF8|nr:hypothetical protein [Acinetobacter baumannii]
MLHDINLKIDAGEYRLAADDPDEENTLATAVFTLDANHVRWQIFDINRDDAKFQEARCPEFQVCVSTKTNYQKNSSSIK